MINEEDSAADEELSWHTDVVALSCPSCGEPIEVVIDPSAGEQQYVEDCQVCCQPMLLTIETDADGEPRVSVAREDE